MERKKQDKQGVNRGKPLCKFAEETMRTMRARRSPVTDRDLRRLVQELEVHRVELKLQNEELRKAQLELAAVRDCYTVLYEFAPLAYVTLGKSARILESNLMTATMLGVERQNLVRADLAKSVTRESQDDWYLHRQAVLSNDAKQVCEIRLQRADRTALPRGRRASGSEKERNGIAVRRLLTSPR